MPLKVLAVVIFSVGTSLSMYFIVLWHRWRAVGRWNRVPGRILRTGFSGGHLTFLGGNIETYTPTVEYEYSHQGLSYLGSRITVRDENLSTVERTEAQAVLDKLGMRPDVYFDPMDPQCSYLINQLKWRDLDYLLTYILSGFILAAIGLGIFLL